jgi:hypothetical protein
MIPAGVAVVVAAVVAAAVASFGYLDLQVPCSW